MSIVKVYRLQCVMIGNILDIQCEDIRRSQKVWFLLFLFSYRWFGCSCDL